MTTVVGVADGRRVVLAADRRMILSARETGDPVRRFPGVRKVFRLRAYPPGDSAGAEDVLLGGAGSLAVLAMIRHELPPVFVPGRRGEGDRERIRLPRRDDDAGLEAFCWQVGRELDRLVRDAGKLDEDGEPRHATLIGVRGQLYEVGAASVMRCAREWTAIGSGSGYAMGALELFDQQYPTEAPEGMNTAEWLDWRARCAVSVASELDPCTGDGIDVEQIDPGR